MPVQTKPNPEAKLSPELDERVVPELFIKRIAKTAFDSRVGYDVAVNGEKAGVLSIGYADKGAGKIATINHIQIDEPHRGQGIGKQIYTNIANLPVPVQTSDGDLELGPSLRDQNGVFQSTPTKSLTPFSRNVWRRFADQGRAEFSHETGRFTMLTTAEPDTESQPIVIHNTLEDGVTGFPEEPRRVITLD